MYLLSVLLQPVQTRPGSTPVSLSKGSYSCADTPLKGAPSSESASGNTPLLTSARPIGQRCQTIMGVIGTQTCSIAPCMPGQQQKPSVYLSHSQNVVDLENLLLRKKNSLLGRGFEPLQADAY